MDTRGISFHFFPHQSGDGSFVLMVYLDQWEDGTCSESAGFHRSLIEVDPEWINRIPDEQFAVLALEVASQVLTLKTPTDMAERFRKDVAEQVRATETLSQGM